MMSNLFYIGFMKKKKKSDPAGIDRERVIGRQRLSWEAMFYSIQRIDLLIVAICGGGIYVCLELIKFLAEKSIAIHWLIKVSGGLFLLALIVNLIGQIFGQKANENDFLMCESQLDGDDEKLINHFDCKADQFTKLTDWMTYGSLAVMAIALILVLVYFVAIF